MKNIEINFNEDDDKPVMNYLIQYQNMNLDWTVEVLYYGMLKEYALLKSSVKTRVPFKTCSIGKRRLRRIRAYLRKQAKIKTLELNVYKCNNKTTAASEVESYLKHNMMKRASISSGVDVIFKYNMLKVI